MARGRICIVTGGAGFIGCAASAPLAANFDRVIAFDNLHPQIHSPSSRPAQLAAGVELVVGDITNPAAWDSLLAEVKPDTVVHLAAETGTGQSLLEAARHTHVNVSGVAVMLDALVRNNAEPRRIVLTSSRAVYGEGAWRRAYGDVLFYPGQRSRTQLAQGVWGFDGTPAAMNAAITTPAPVSVYGATKLAQEHVLAAWCTAIGTELVILRFQNVYGPGQSLINSYTGIVSLFCQLARQSSSIPLYEDGAMLRDFVFIEDVASALVAGTTRQGVAGAVLDIGSGQPCTIAEAARIVCDIYGAPAPHVCGKYRFGDVRHAFADISEARRQLGWTPTVSVNEGLRRLSAWINESLQAGSQG